MSISDGPQRTGRVHPDDAVGAGFFLDSDKRWKRKLAELIITAHLEHKLTKQQIFEDYANQVYLGRTGPFSIHGFGEGARVFFGKDLSQVSNSEAAYWPEWCSGQAILIHTAIPTAPTSAATSCSA